MPRTAEEGVHEPHDLLDAAKIERPYVLVAHSLGGLFARLYASTYPGNVAGLVLVDAWHEAMPKLLGPVQWQPYEALFAPPLPALETYRDLETIDFGVASECMAELEPDVKHVIAKESDHYIHIEQPDLVIDAVRQVVDAVRDPASRRPDAE